MSNMKKLAAEIAKQDTSVSFAGQNDFAYVYYTDGTLLRLGQIGQITYLDLYDANYESLGANKVAWSKDIAADAIVWRRKVLAEQSKL